MIYLLRLVIFHMLNYQGVVDASEKLTDVELMLLMLKCSSEQLLVSFESSAQVGMEDTKVFETTKKIHREVAFITKGTSTIFIHLLPIHQPFDPILNHYFSYFLHPAKHQRPKTHRPAVHGMRRRGMALKDLRFFGDPKISKKLQEVELLLVAGSVNDG